MSSVNLKKFLEKGGFLLASPGCSSPDWDRSFRSELGKILPNTPLRTVPMTHKIFKTVYDIDTISVRHGKPKPIEGVELNGRIVVVYSADGLNDTAHVHGCCCCGGNEVTNCAQINVNVLAQRVDALNSSDVEQRISRIFANSFQTRGRRGESDSNHGCACCCVFAQLDPFGLRFRHGNKSSATTSPAQSANPTSPLDSTITFVVSGDTAGFIVPCGCTTKQFGGLPRRATYLNELRKTLGDNLVYIDAGGSVNRASLYDKLKLEYIAKGMTQMKVAALNIGVGEMRC